MKKKKKNGKDSGLISKVTPSCKWPINNNNNNNNNNNDNDNDNNDNKDNNYKRKLLLC